MFFFRNLNFLILDLNLASSRRTGFMEKVNAAISEEENGNLNQGHHTAAQPQTDLTAQIRHQIVGFHRISLRVFRIFHMREGDRNVNDILYGFVRVEAGLVQGHGRGSDVVTPISTRDETLIATFGDAIADLARSVHFLFDTLQMFLTTKAVRLREDAIDV